MRLSILELGELFAAKFQKSPNLEKIKTLVTFESFKLQSPFIHF